MSFLIQHIVDLHDYIAYDMPGINKPFVYYPMMGSPIPIFLLSYFYIYFCTKLGPKLMKDREPFSLKWTLIIYNVFQVLINFYGVVWTIITFSKFFSHGGYYLCALKTDQINSQIDDHTFEMIYTELQKHTYFYIILKIVDFFDTIFMVLRKNFHQITLLHVYHHASMPFISFVMAKHLPLSQEMYIGLANLFVHFIMYGYYLLTAYNPQFKSNVTFKKSITILQLFQFCFMLLMTTLITIQDNDCPISLFKSFVCMGQAILMIVLFSNFYYKAYIRPKNKLKKND